jgi:hypothetical protein
MGLKSENPMTSYLMRKMSDVSNISTDLSGCKSTGKKAREEDEAIEIQNAKTVDSFVISSNSENFTMTLTEKQETEA